VSSPRPTESPFLRSGGADLLPRLVGQGSRRLSDRLPPPALAGRFAEPVTGPGAGPHALQSVGIDEWHEDGILVEATVAPPGMTSFVRPGFGKDLKRELNDAGNLGMLGAMVADRPSGRVRKPAVPSPSTPCTPRTAAVCCGRSLT
jgi:hypothetical protein